MSMSPLDQCLVWWITAKKSRRLCAHLCSWAAMCTESMIRRRASEICLALIVCCSNLVFTADWEMHSCKHTHIYDSQTNTQTHLNQSHSWNPTTLTSKRLSKFWNSNILAWKPSARAPPENPTRMALQGSCHGKEDFSCSFKIRVWCLNVHIH